MNPSELRTDSIKNNPVAVINYDQQLNLVAKEVGGIKGVKVKYFPNANKQQGAKNQTASNINKVAKRNEVEELDFRI